MKTKATIPAWMRSGRPDAIHKNCINVQEGLVEACDFDPAMCQACESSNCKWHPAKASAGRDAEDVEEEDDEADEVDSDDESDHDSADDGTRDDDDL